jgi:hypothetical protein
MAGAAAAVVTRRRPLGFGGRRGLLQVTRASVTLRIAQKGKTGEGRL